MKIDVNINNSVTSDLKDIFKTNLNKIILYGSFARGDESLESDVDYLILTRLSDDEIKDYNKRIVDLSYKYLDNYNILFSFIVINSNQFDKYSDTLPFYNNIVKEGTVIYA
jgi:predicted nucleotidyltransferase